MSTERVTVTDAEAVRAGVVATATAWGERLAPLLAARGVPQRKLTPGYVPFRMTRTASDDGFVLEFGDIADHAPEINRLTA